MNHEKDYTVSWHITIQAGSHKEAAQKALDIQRDPTSEATIFKVKRWGADEVHTIDLYDLHCGCGKECSEEELERNGGVCSECR